MRRNVMLCHRGCGLEATFTNYLGEPCCFKAAPKCPVVKQKAGERSGLARKGKPLSSERQEQLRSALLGRECKPETRAKIKESNKEHWKANPRDPWNKGKIGVQIPWNRGRTGYSMPPRRKISEQDYKNYQKYKRAVYSATRKTYNKNINLLNPNGLLIGRCGIVGAHQIDHKVPISLGYQLKIPVTIMSLVENLQLMPWKDNLDKSNKNPVNEEILSVLLE
jgi:5-methylcytosine-specific restriction endonuclease McrA